MNLQRSGGSRDLLEDPALPQMRIVLSHVVAGLDNPGCNSDRLQQVHGFFGILFHRPRLNQLVQFIRVFQPGYCGSEPLFQSPTWRAKRLNKSVPFLRIEHGDGQPAVIALTAVGPVGRSASVGLPVAGALYIGLVDAQFQRQRPQ